MTKFIVTAALSAFCACAYAQTDSIGIYKVDNAGISRIEAARPAYTKISAGLIKSKAKVVFNGASSQNRFRGSATFRLYFGTPSPYEAAKYFMFTPSYSVKDFMVGKFEVKKENRYLTTASASIVGSKIGVSTAKAVNVEYRRLRDNVYEITVTGPAGEYCIMPVLNGTAGYAGVFDFALE